MDGELDIDLMRAELLARRGELARLRAAPAQARRAVELDQTKVGRLSRMDALQSQQMALQLNVIEPKRVRVLMLP